MSSNNKIRLFGLFLLCSLLAVLYICFLLDQRTEKAIIAHYQNSAKSSLATADDRVTRLFLKLAHELEDLMENPHMQNAERLSGKPMRINEILYPFSTVDKVVGNIHLLFDDGSILSLWEQPQWTAESLKQKKLRIEPMKVIVDHVLWLTYDTSNPDSTSIYISQRIQNRQGVPFARLLTEIKLQALAQLFHDLPIGGRQERMLVSPAGKILYHTDETMLGKQMDELPYYQDMKKNFGRDLEEGISSFLKEGQRTYVFRYVSPQNGFLYYQMVPEAAIKADLLSARLLTISIPLIVFGVGGYVYYMFVRMNRPHPVPGKLPPARVLKVANPPQKEMIQKGLEPVVLGFYLAVEMKDPYTAGHTERVTRYALAIYDQMGEEQKRRLPRDDLRYAGLLHDIGKVAIPDHILQKEGKLTDEEYEQIKRHPTVGANLVEQIETLAHVSPGVRYHHERWDGKGYPEQLKGEEIPLAGRILAVADTFDAMTSSRTYRKALSPQTALEEILRCSDTQFDPYVVEMFAEAYRKGAIQARQQEGEAG